jgi:hypothetical protein
MRPRFALALALALVAALGLVATAAPALAARPARGVALYPDLQTLRPADLHLAVLPDGRHVLRFSNTVWNAGEGRLELEGNPKPQRDVVKQIYQNLYDAASGGALVSHKPAASDVVYHPTHRHYHFADFASYVLLEQDGDAYAETTKRGTKTSFCVMDTTRVGGAARSQYGGCGRELQGLSVGWGDTYDWTLADQWVVLGEPLANGEYGLRSTADPSNRLDEGGRDGNNAATVYFTMADGQITHERDAP